MPRKRRAVDRRGRPRKRHAGGTPPGHDCPSEFTLPLHDGPQLRRFEHDDCVIKWGKRLGDDEESAHGYVYRATIENRDYAVKIFKFYDPMLEEHFWGPLLGENTPLEVAAILCDPFMNECRAYGRIHESQWKTTRLAKAAIPCFGYMFLKMKDFQLLSEQNPKMELGLKNVSQAYQQSKIWDGRPRAIVKELASSESGVSEGTLADILCDIRVLNRHGIYNMDIRQENFRDSKLIDFGSAYTEPHPLLNAQKLGAIRADKMADREGFDQMVKDEDISNPKNIQAVHPMRLRPRKI